jgi:muramidase (phage lysozyme)
MTRAERFAELREHANVRAFLALIRRTEGTEPNAIGWDPYRVTYGYDHELASLDRHPADPAWGQERWRGVRLPDKYCRSAGLRPPCHSTAAGAYQFIWPTWRGLMRSYGFRDFSRGAQDHGAIALLAERHAVDAIIAGDLLVALNLASKEWASLPFSLAGQPKFTLAEAREIYGQAGGSFVA